MSASKSAEVRAVTAVNVKPEVEITDAYFGPYYGDHRLLFGVPVNHYRTHLNGRDIHSSGIVKQDGDTVETLNTIYKVISWSDKAPEGSPARSWKRKKAFTTAVSETDL